MNSIQQMISILSDGKFHSGEDLGRQLGVSRSAVWKKIKMLESYGLLVHAIKGKGYKLSKALELLNREKILTLLDPEIKPVLGSLTVLNTVDSTNQYLMNIIDTSEFNKQVVLTEYQYAGRGRRGRDWVSPYAGGVMMSIGWHFEMTPNPLTIISLATGIAIMRLLERIGIRKAGLKWPNDIYWQESKLGGMLVELKSESNGPCNVIVGAGINYSFPDRKIDTIDQPWTDISSILQKPISRNLISAVMISELYRVLTSIRNGNISNIINEWRKYDIMKGKCASLLLPGSEIQGRLLGIDDSGALLMSVNGTIKKFNSGEISLRVQH